ncbi:MAG TPA: ArsI/CadI family heavy metal resistance metalloenzyme [Casimicrobiaceae bacterium]|nr:ArsI/CadI family heavy metal resistance metalloenzyme [Casimicrobiaceae bacterium]
MKRFHVHVGVADIDRSVAFYSALFGAGPTVRHADYAKWMLDEPRINFAISLHDVTGIDHIGLQVDSADELAEVRARFAAADETSLIDEPGARCCYAKGDKHWLSDPQGVRWEGFHTLEPLAFFGAHEAPKENACCGQRAVATTGTCCG